MTKSNKSDNLAVLYANLMIACSTNEEQAENLQNPQEFVVKRKNHEKKRKRQLLQRISNCEICCEDMIMAAGPVPEEKPRTFLMRWNPAISSHTITDYEYALAHVHREGFYYDWSIWDYRKARVGDTFYMIRVGEGNTGIVMRGTLASRAFRGEDWSGRGRSVYYVRMYPEYMFHPESPSILSTGVLNAFIPEVNWNEGHSGVLLSDEVAEKLDRLWRKFIHKLPQNAVF